MNVAERELITIFHRRNPTIPKFSISPTCWVRISWPGGHNFRWSQLPLLVRRGSQATCLRLHERYGLGDRHGHLPYRTGDCRAGVRQVTEPLPLGEQFAVVEGPVRVCGPAAKRVGAETTRPYEGPLSFAVSWCKHAKWNLPHWEVHFSVEQQGGQKLRLSKEASHLRQGTSCSQWRDIFHPDGPGDSRPRWTPGPGARGYQLRHGPEGKTCRCRKGFYFPP